MYFIDSHPAPLDSYDKLLLALANELLLITLLYDELQDLNTTMSSESPMSKINAS